MNPEKNIAINIKNHVVIALHMVKVPKDIIPIIKLRNDDATITHLTFPML